MPSEERARVISVRGGRATLELDRKSSCGSCGLCSALGNNMRLDVDAVEGLKPGQTVIVSLSRAGSLISILLLFALPLVGLVGGVLLGQLWKLPRLSTDASSILFAVAGLAAAFAVAILYDRTVAAKTAPRPEIVRIEEGPPTGNPAGGASSDSPT